MRNAFGYDPDEVDFDDEQTVYGKPLQKWFKKFEPCPFCNKKTVGAVARDGMLNFDWKCYTCDEAVQVARWSGRTAKPGEEMAPTPNEDGADEGGADEDGADEDEREPRDAKRYLSLALFYGGILACLSIVGIPLGLAMIVASMLIGPKEGTDDADE